MTLPWLYSERGGPQHHPQLRFIGSTVRHGGGRGRTASSEWWEAWFLSLAKFPKSEDRTVCTGAPIQGYKGMQRKKSGVGWQQHLVQWEEKCPISLGCWQGDSSAEGKQLGCASPWLGEGGTTVPGGQLHTAPCPPALGRASLRSSTLLENATFLLGLFCWGGRECVWSPGLRNAQRFIAP